MSNNDFPIKNLVIDMDGVLWRGETAMPGLVEFFDAMRTLGLEFVLATNNATKSVSQYVEKLARLGANVPGERILTSAEATAMYLRQHFPQGTTTYVIGEHGLRSALSTHGFAISEVNEPPGDDTTELVVAGLARDVCYRQLAYASLHIERGAAFVGTNPDPTLPTEDGAAPGAGAILAFLEASTGVQPIIIGKPNRAIFDQALARIKAAPSETAMVGDRLGTDIAGGHAAGLATILLLSGATRREEANEASVSPDWIFDDIGSLTEFLWSNAPGAST